MVHEADDNAQRIGLLRAALEELATHRDPSMVAEARHVAEVAATAERDRSVCRVEQLAAAAGTSVRTLQRLFDQHVGVSPSFVIRRWRIIEAAEAARTALDGGADWRGWASVAAELGYSDQSHLTRDFRRHLGTSPSAYLGRLDRSPEPAGNVSNSSPAGRASQFDQSAAVASISDISPRIANRSTPSRVIGGAASIGPNRAPSTSKCSMASCDHDHGLITQATPAP